jgi:hypothetical protein
MLVLVTILLSLASWAKGAPPESFLKLPETQVLPASLLRYRVDLAAYLARHDMVWPEGPSGHWARGAPLGNGDFGAMVYGYPDNLTFALGKTDIWDRRHADHSPFPGGTFADLREAVLKSDKKRFAELEKARRTVEPEDIASFTAAGTLTLHVAEACLAQKCAQRVSLWDAECVYGFTDRGMGKRADGYPAEVGLRCFVSRVHDVLAIRIWPGEGVPLTLGWEITRAPRQGWPAAASGQAEGVAFLRQRMYEKDEYVIACATDGPAPQTRAAGRRVICDLGEGATKPVTLYLTIVTNRDAADPMAEAQRRLREARRLGWDGLRAAHQKWWHDYWAAANVCLDEPDVERPWYVANYLCASMMRPGKQCPGLQGVWVKENFPPWYGDYHANVNIQSEFWGTLGSNHPELMEPYLRLYTNMLPELRKETAEYFKMRGARIPIATSEFGMEWSDWTPLNTGVGHSAFVAKWFWHYYEYTQDRDYLARIGYPMLREVADFYSDYLMREADGTYSVVPAIYFELYGNAFEAMGRNTCWDVGLVRKGLEMALAAARVLGVDEERQKDWQNKLDHLAPIPTIDGNVWKPFQDRPEIPDWAWARGWLIFPFEVAGKYQGPPALRAQAEATYKYLAERGSAPQSWCGGVGTGVAVRMGDPARAFDLARMSKTDINGAGVGWEGMCLQMDHGPGMSRAINDLLVVGLDGVLHVFGGIPADHKARFHSLRTAGGFLVSGEKRGPEPDYVLVQSLAGMKLCIANPFAAGARVRLREVGATTALYEGSPEALAVVEVPTEKGKVYVLEKAAAPLESLPMETAQPKGTAK